MLKRLIVLMLFATPAYAGTMPPACQMAGGVPQEIRACLKAADSCKTRQNCADAKAVCVMAQAAVAQANICVAGALNLVK